MTSAEPAHDTDHDTLVREAVSLGYKEDQIVRMPTYVIASMVAERKKKKKKHHAHDGKPPRTGAEDVRVYEEQLTDVEQTVHRLHEARLATPSNVEEALGPADALDDAKTVVNMDFVTSTDNPSDQKYQRFSFLVAAKNDLILAIKKNTALLSTEAQQLDQDDVAVMQHDIAQAQAQLALVNREIRDIHQWFAEVHQQKHVFYQQFLKRSTDLTGNLSTHFQRKIENIQKYMRSMSEHAQLQVSDVK